MDALSRLRWSEAGFNLVEMMVALMIIGVLTSIAIPIYLGAVERADDVAARASLHTAQVAGRQIAQDAPDYTAASVDALEEVEPSIQWVDAADPSLGPTVVSRDVVAGKLLLAAYSPTGTCFFLRDDPEGEVGRASLVGVERVDCTAENAITMVFEPTW